MRFPSRSRRTRVVAGAATAVAALAILAPGASAQATEDDAALTVSPGTASVSVLPTFGNFDAVQLNGTSTLPTKAQVTDWAVNDATGSGNGWEVTMSATTPTSDVASGSQTLNVATLNLAAPTATAGAGQAAEDLPAVLGGNLLGGSVKVADADPGKGEGLWNLAHGADALTLTVPVDARALTYTTKVTTTFTPGV